MASTATVHVQNFACGDAATDWSISSLAFTPHLALIAHCRRLCFQENVQHVAL